MEQIFFHGGVKIKQIYIPQINLQKGVLTRIETSDYYFYHRYYRIMLKKIQEYIPSSLDKISRKYRNMKVRDYLSEFMNYGDDEILDFMLNNGMGGYSIDAKNLLFKSSKYDIKIRDCGRAIMANLSLISDMKNRLIILIDTSGFAGDPYLFTLKLLKNHIKNGGMALEVSYPLINSPEIDQFMECEINSMTPMFFKKLKPGFRKKSGYKKYF